MREPSALTVVIRGAGGMATGIAIRLLRAGISRLCLLEKPFPLSIHRLAAFAEAVLEGYAVVEGVTAALISQPSELPALWDAGCAGLLVDPQGFWLREIRPDVIIDTTHSQDACLSLTAAPLIIGLRPVHAPGVHAHLVIETAGPGLGRVLHSDSDLPRAGLAGHMSGFGAFIVHAPHGGVFRTQRDIGEYVESGESVGSLAEPGTLKACGEAVRAPVSGILRGLLRDYAEVERHARLAYIDPREDVVCHQLSDRVLAVGGGVLEAVLGALRTRPQPRAGILTL
ncbi:MAG: molybdenum hydroxylase [Deltaproteobacteria bacterium]|jgi:xanthine dehydrogenase accessory factor|nr:molybdenum hydroxylase [Deltaproteobacteria bacterium]